MPRRFGRKDGEPLRRSYQIVAGGRGVGPGFPALIVGHPGFDTLVQSSKLRHYRSPYARARVLTSAKVAALVRTSGPPGFAAIWGRHFLACLALWRVLVQLKCDRLLRNAKVFSELAERRAPR
jgi:hypothetical protein